MGADNKSNGDCNKGKKRKHRYLPHNRPVKKGSYPLHPGVQGFFITCDGGRERQATNEAINLLDTFYEELVHGENSVAKTIKPSKPLNKITKFSDSESSSSDDESQDNAQHENEADEGEKTTAKKQCLETDASKCEKVDCDKTEEKPVDKLIEIEGKPIDKLIEAELEELGNRNKRHFVSLDSGCNGVVFIQMHKRAGDPGPTEIVQHMMRSAASTRKHMSRFILRVLPVEVTCYASEEEISKAIKPLISQYFPTEATTPQKTICLVGVVESYKELAKYNLRQLTSPKA
ncbi:THUMP domain-containing protein isoform X2 [Tasmannia lanceolata]|uniref:THUMP domain-containing protein isoform X2 n=1 Tax=Tasmannia lanceolata TaxID=3420 RepID=UPI004062C812